MLLVHICQPFSRKFFVFLYKFGKFGSNQLLIANQKLCCIKMLLIIKKKKKKLEHKTKNILKNGWRIRALFIDDFFNIQIKPEIYTNVFLSVC